MGSKRPQVEREEEEVKLKIFPSRTEGKRETEKNRFEDEREKGRRRKTRRISGGEREVETPKSSTREKGSQK